MDSTAQIGLKDGCRLDKSFTWRLYLSIHIDHPPNGKKISHLSFNNHLDRYFIRRFRISTNTAPSIQQCKEGSEYTSGRRVTEGRFSLPLLDMQTRSLF